MHLQLLQLTCKCGHLHLGRRGRKSGRQGGAAAAPSASQAQSLPLTSNQGPCLPASLQLPQLRASRPPLTPLGLICPQQRSMRKAGSLSLPSLCPQSPQLSRACLARQLPSDGFCSSSFISGFLFNTSQTYSARFVGLVFFFNSNVVKGSKVVLMR